jgi:1-acyl-sn-glycerol-3-phosphate acyltransferase
VAILVKIFLIKATDLIISSYRIIWIFGICCLMAPVILIFLALGMKPDWGHRYLRPIWTTLVLRGSGIRHQAINLSQISGNHPCIFVVNHVSDWDIFIFTHCISQPWRAVIKADLRTFPVVGSLAARLDQIFLRRDGGAEGMIEQCLPHLENGRSILFFPEGRRTTGHLIDDFRSGAFLLARRSGRAILPIIIAEKKEILEPGAFGRKFGHLPGKSRLVVGEPLLASPRAKEEAAVAHLKNQAHEQMREMLRMAYDQNQ